jgi:hypothetical protein
VINQAGNQLSDGVAFSDITIDRRRVMTDVAIGVATGAITGSLAYSLRGAVDISRNLFRSEVIDVNTFMRVQLIEFGVNNIATTVFATSSEILSGVQNGDSENRQLSP